MQIDWNSLEKNTTSKELSFESFNFQIAWKKFIKYGRFDYNYNTPGAEFFLTMEKDYQDLGFKISDVLGWQAKFWVNHNDMDNTQMSSKRRGELKEGLKKALKLKRNLKAWFICTPGQIETKAKEKLEKDLVSIKPNLKIIFWNKPIYETFYHESHSKFNPIFSHYFSTEFIGYEFLNSYTKKRIKKLEKKFDTELYVTSSVNEEIDLVLDYKKILSEFSLKSHDWQNYLKYGRERSISCQAEIDKNEQLEVCLSDMLSFLILFGDELHSQIQTHKGTNNIINALKDISLYIDKKIKQWNEIIKKYQESKEKGSNKNSSNRFSLDNEINSQYQLFGDVIDLYHKIFQSDLHIFGKAGFGKTNLACSVCEKSIEQDIPALLLLASDIRVETDMSTWIVESLQTKHSFSNLLGFLDNLGFLKQRKIPIVIDGLNEKFPDVSYWKSQLKYITEDVSRFQNLLLITTSRESYIEEIFDSPSYKEVQNNHYLEGFVKYNRSIAIKKYFNKYGIEIANKDYDDSIFQNPLLLKIFCIVHKDKIFAFSPTNIYETMQGYYDYLINKISDFYPNQKTIMRKIIEERIHTFCLKLLDNKSKHIDYINAFFDIFDPDFIPSSQPQIVLSDKILDEGLFIRREMSNHNETVEFTHDFIGGYSIAKAVALSTTDPEQLLENVLNESVMGKVVNFKTGAFQHPLSEDILRNLIYFIKKKTGKQLFDVLQFKSILKLSLSMLETSDLSKEEQLNLIETLQLSDNKNLIIYFFEHALNKIIDRTDYSYFDILSGLIEQLSAREIDLYWSETVRKNVTKILKYLNRLSNIEVNSNYADYKTIYFLSCLLSSTNRYLRDLTTSLLVKFGELSPDILFLVLKNTEKVADVYIEERILASLCGVILRKKGIDKTLYSEIGNYLENKYFKKISTTHLLILDYVDVILHHLVTTCNYKRKNEIDPKQLCEWEKDEKCSFELTSDGKATWGYGPIHMDFAKYTIGHHIASYSYGPSAEKLSTLKETIAMIIWRMKKLGYDEELFKDVDRECAKSRYDYSRHDNSVSIERYGKKYSWIAYFELYGQLVLQKKVKADQPNTFRVSAIDIDPTFPSLPPKRQLVSKCFLPNRREKIQDWVNRKDKHLFKDLYRLKDSNTNWVLINCRSNQEVKKDVRIDINLDALIVEKINAKKILASLKKENNVRFDTNTPEYYYLFNGEIPKGKYLQNEVIGNLFEETNLFSFYSSYSWFAWESYHSRMNDIGNVPFLSKAICDEFDLSYDIRSLSFFDHDGPVTKYYHDRSSHFYFLKEDHLQKFLENNNLSLIWGEFIYKYGDFGMEKTKNLNPSYSETKSFTPYIYE